MIRKAFFLIFFVSLISAFLFTSATPSNAISCSGTTTESGSGTSCPTACAVPVSSGCSQGNPYCYVCGSQDCCNVPLDCSWTCSASYCSGCTYYYNVSCSSSIGLCYYSNSQSNSSYCGCGAAPTPTPTPQPTCVSGTGTTDASCGGNQTACMCNGSTCETQGYYCSAGSCVKGWAGGTTCSQSSCNGGAGCGPTPTPTTCSSSNCSGQTACMCNGTTCQTQGYGCSGGSCVGEWALGTTCSQSSCNGGSGCSGGTSYTCQQCSGSTCSSYSSSSPCTTDCSACSGATCMINKNTLQGKT